MHRQQQREELVGRNTYETLLQLMLVTPYMLRARKVRAARGTHASKIVMSSEATPPLRVSISFTAPLKDAGPETTTRHRPRAWSGSSSEWSRSRVSRPSTTSTFAIGASSGNPRVGSLVGNGAAAAASCSETATTHRCKPLLVGLGRV